MPLRGVYCLLFVVCCLLFGVWRLAFGVWRLGLIIIISILAHQLIVTLLNPIEQIKPLKLKKIQDPTSSIQHQASSFNPTLKKPTPVKEQALIRFEGRISFVC